MVNPRLHVWSPRWANETPGNRSLPEVQCAPESRWDWPDNTAPVCGAPRQPGLEPLDHPRWRSPRTEKDFCPYRAFFQLLWMPGQMMFDNILEKLPAARRASKERTRQDLLQFQRNGFSLILCPFRRRMGKFMVLWGFNQRFHRSPCNIQPLFYGKATSLATLL